LIEFVEQAKNAIANPCIGNLQGNVVMVRPSSRFGVIAHDIHCAECGHAAMHHVRFSRSSDHSQCGGKLNDTADLLLEQRNPDTNPKIWHARTRRQGVQEIEDPFGQDDATPYKGLPSHTPLCQITFSSAFSVKIQRADDLGLPPRTVIIRRDYFNPEEKELYLSLFSDAKRQFSTYVDQGTILNSMRHVSCRRLAPNTFL
jgi:hypothetical protein